MSRDLFSVGADVRLYQAAAPHFRQKGGNNTSRPRDRGRDQAVTAARLPCDGHTNSRRGHLFGGATLQPVAARMSSGRGRRGPAGPARHGGRRAPHAALPLGAAPRNGATKHDPTFGKFIRHGNEEGPTVAYGRGVAWRGAAAGRSRGVCVWRRPWPSTRHFLAPTAWRPYG